MESTAPFAVPMRRACILLVAAAVLFAALALAGCSRRVVRDPEVVRLVEAIATEEESFEFEDDYIRAPIALGDLIKRGAGAVPTLLDMLPETNDEWTAMMMLEAIGRIGDPRAREPVERLLTSPARGIAEKALAALVRLGPQQSIPAMRALLERPDCGGFRRAHLLCTLLLAGGDSAIEPTIDLGLANENERSDAIEALLQHEPLRTVLGLKQAGWIGLEEEPLLRAAKEWVLERRGQPSPWKPAADFAFAEPFAAEKQQAFDLVRQKGWLAEGGVRILPVDVAVPDTVPREPVAVLFSGGHAHSIAFDVWQPHGDFVRFHRFHADFRWVQSAFPETEMQESYAVADAPIAAVQRAVAGMRAALAARVLPWWCGPYGFGGKTTANFGVVVFGATAAGAARSFCGYEGAHDLPRYAGLAAASDWHFVVAKQVERRLAVADDDAKKLFSELWQRCRDQWGRDNLTWWFVRELMVALAAAFGNESLVPSLLDFVQPRHAEGKSSMARTAAHACTALAAITGVDLRFDDRGAPRPLADVAKDYRERLTRK